MIPSSVQNAFYGLREYVTPVLKDSNFIETGVLKPEEFVAAGDYLVFKCPTWSWESGHEGYRKSFLPKDKQYLITRNVPCDRRASSPECPLSELAVSIDGTGPSNDSDQWIMAEESIFPKPNEGHPDPNNLREQDLAGGLIERDPANALLTEEDLYNRDMNIVFDRHTLRTRTYDLSITYDKYYQVPRLWLQGFDEQGIPLKPQQIFQDVSQEHARKTITMEPHPHIPLVLASIHPCKHANIMKMMIQVLKAQKGAEQVDATIRVEQYLVLFLKFMSSVLPTIDYDYTISIE